MRKLVGLAIVASALVVSACNTVEGAGKDVSSAGRTVAKTATTSPKFTLYHSTTLHLPSTSQQQDD